MQRLRQARDLARLVLAWFALAVAAAIASPIAQPQSLELVCSGGAMKLLVKADGGEPAATHTLDCPLCASVAPPPPLVRAAVVLAPTGELERSIPAGSPVARPAAPLPARGPPIRLA